MALFSSTIRSYLAKMSVPEGNIGVVKAKAEFTNETILFALRKKEAGSKRFVRSYESFKELRSALQKAHPQIFVPSIPDAPYPQLLSDPEHVEKKRRRLNKFLQQVQANPALVRDPVFVRFCSPGPFVADTERPKSPTLSREVSRVTGFFKNLYNGVTGKSSLAAVTSVLTMTQGLYSDIPILDPELIHTAEEFASVRSQVLRLANESGVVVEAISRHDIALRALARGYALVGQSVFHMSRVEGRAPLADLLSMAAQALTNAQTLTHDQAQRAVICIGDPYVQLGRDVSAFKDVVNHRTTSLQAYENAQKRVSRAHSEKAKSAHDANSRADPRALQAECDAAELDEKDSREGYVSAHAAMVNQWEAYDKEREEMCLQGLRTHVQWQLEYERKKLAMWSGLLKQLTGENAPPTPTPTQTA